MDHKSELACTYAALILADDDIEVTADKINTLLKASSCKFVEPFMSSLFASALNGRNVKEIVSSASSVSAGPAVAAAAPTGSTAAAPAAAAEAKVEKKVEKEESEESEGDMGFDLFG